MRGQVYVEYRRLGFFAVQTDEKPLYNETTQEELKVSIASIQLTLVEAKRYIKNAVRGI